MKRLEFLCSAFLVALVFASCGIFEDGNPAVKEPTVDQMKDLDRQWGLKPQTTTPRFNAPAETATPPAGIPTFGTPTQEQIDSLPLIPATPKTAPLPAVPGSPAVPSVPVIPPSLR
jgi:hypothetical protein